jgi:transposase
MHNFFTSRNDKLLSEEVEAYQSYFGGEREGKRGRGTENKCSTLVSLKDKERSRLTGSQGCISLKNLLKETIKKVKRETSLYTDKFRSY